MLTFLILIVYAVFVGLMAFGIVTLCRSKQSDNNSGALGKIALGFFGVVATTVGLEALGLSLDLAWFNDLGHGGVFWTRFNTQVFLWFAGAIPSGILIYLLTGFAVRALPREAPKKEEPAPERRPSWDYTPRRDRREDLNNNEMLQTGLRWLLTIVGAIVWGCLWTSEWQKLLMWQNGVPFGKTDPVFGNDISYYVFQLPFIHEVVSWIGWIVWPALVLGCISLFTLASNASDALDDGVFNTWLTRAIRGAVNVASLCLIHWSAVLWFGRYGYLQSEAGRVYGVGYTEINGDIPAHSVAIVLLLLTVLLLQGLKYGKQSRMCLAAAPLVFAIAQLIIVPTWIQHVTVNPSELELERPFLARTIQATNEAFGLDKAEHVSLKPGSLDLAAVKAEPATIGNVRIVDPRPFLDDAHQEESLRTYYVFSDSHPDRYRVNGQLKQLLVSPRELETEDLPEASKTFNNERMVYTHGYGIVASVASEIGTQGLPAFRIKGFPPKSELAGIDVKRPGIYFGRHTKDYVLVKTTMQEQDRPDGDSSAYTTYDGPAGVEVGPTISLRRLALALRFDGIKIFLSDYLTPQSKALWNREINARLTELAPFVSWDGDAYPVVTDDGHIVWINDGYTGTTEYPYSHPPQKDGWNYMRNSVKATVDAFTGETRIYLVDEEPVVRTWAAAFPGLFTPATKMPKDIRAHLRYPHWLLTVQANVWEEYHMLDPKTFYNREDPWTVAQEKYGDKAQDMVPYYSVAKLPGHTSEEFLAILPMTPKARPVTTALVVGRSDGDNYGKLVIYRFPKDNFVMGPLQFEAKIDQDQEMSAKLTLWKQKGSEIIRGNTLLLPVGSGLMYFEPIYLQAASVDGQKTKATIPELVKVAVGYGEKVAWGDSLDEALGTLFADKAVKAEVAQAVAASGGSSDNIQELLTRLRQQAKALLETADQIERARSTKK